MIARYQVPRNALLLMLAAQVLVILPHVMRLPVWLTLMCVGCVVWRVMVYQGRWSYPGPWIKALFVFGGFIGVGFGYGSLLGLEPWVGILIVAFVLKLLEMHQKRDAYTVIVLAYFVALTEFLFEQGIPYAMYIYLCVTVITAALIGLNQTALNVRPAQTLKRASFMLLQAVPLMLVLFVLFPRISPLWTVPLQTDVARTGVTDTMSPGDIAQLVQSDELAFRATFEGEIPPYSDLYWRGLVLSRFDGEAQTWRQEEPGLYGRTLRRGGVTPSWEGNMEYVADPVNYSVMLEPTNRNWMFALNLPEASSLEQVGLVRDFRFYSFTEIRSRFRYEVTSYLEHRTDVNLSDFWQYRYTLLPQNDNPETRRLAETIRSNSTSESEYLKNVMRMYAMGDYAYTLRPPKVSGHTIDEFLFDTRRGFCEHFAGSFVYLARAAGIPARVIVGYQGGEFNRRGSYVAVHQFDAHAWAEVWLEGEGWVRMDPTSVVAPERINEGLESAVLGEETFLADVGLSLMKFRSTLWITELRLQLSALNHYWDAWVVGYTPGVQINLLNQYLGEVDRKTIGMIMLSAFFGLLGITAFFLLLKRSQQKLAPVEREYLRFCGMMAKQDIPRSVGEGPLMYGERAAAARPDLAPSIKAVTDTYVKINFDQDEPDHADELKQAVRGLKVRMLA